GAERIAASSDLVRALAELWTRASPRGESGDRPPRVRSRDHALRPGQQLWAALRVGGGDLRQALARRPPAVPRRARGLDQGRLRHVAGPIRRMGLAQVPAREPRPEPGADGPGVR